jgi:ribosomal protein S18 acetylase RimI-like enzyme
MKNARHLGGFFRAYSTDKSLLSCHYSFMADFRFTNEHTSDEVGNVIDVLRRPRLWIPTQKDYPDYDAWLEKTEAEIASDKKRAMLAYMGRQPVGAVIYQRHKEQPRTIEIKNISVSPHTQGRHIGSFMLRNSEIEAIRNDFPDADRLIVDTKVTNADMINFLVNHGYRIHEVTSLYGPESGLDAVLTKSVAK